MTIDRITKYASVLAIAVLISALSACDSLISFLPDDGDDGAVSHTAPVPQLIGLTGEIQIGVVVSETGPYADSYGIPILNGFELARNEINDAQISDVSITFIRVDDQGTVEGAANAFDKLIRGDKVPVILGPTLSSQAREVFPTVQKNQVVALASISAAFRFKRYWRLQLPYQPSQRRAPSQRGQRHQRTDRLSASGYHI